MAAVTVGVLGGAFDPPHVGHVALARAGVERFGLARLLVRVVAEPGHKDVATAPEVRLALAGLAFASLAGAEVALDPFARTVDSLEALPLDDPVFLVGADEFADFLTWKEPDRVLSLARLGVATRPGVDRTGLDAVLARLARPDRVTLFDLEPHAVSSTAIRKRVAAGESIEGLVPVDVGHEIHRLGLYAPLARPETGGMLRIDPSERTSPT
jgi:nicotinate-nucleotide adenylyltransferase